MKLPSFQPELFPAHLTADLDQYEYHRPDQGWISVERPGYYQHVRRLDPGQKHTLDSVHALEQELIHHKIPEEVWIRELDRVCDGVGRRATVWQRLRALARGLERACPDDTDGDGNCGRPACRYCSHHGLSRIEVDLARTFDILSEVKP